MRATPMSSTSRSTTAADSSSHSQIGNAPSPVSPPGARSVLALQCGLALVEETLGLVEVALVGQLGVLAEQPHVVVGDRDESAVDGGHPVTVVHRADVDLTGS